MASDSKSILESVAVQLINPADYYNYPSKNKPVVNYYVWNPGDEQTLQAMLNTERLGPNPQAGAQAGGLYSTLYDPIATGYINQVSGVLSELQKYTKISFNQVSKNQVLAADGSQRADLSFALTDRLDPKDDTASTFQLNTSGNGLIQYDKSVVNDPLNRGYFFIMHEMMHYFGLVHPHDVASLKGGVYDNQKYTIIAYRGHASFNISPIKLNNGSVMSDGFNEVVPSTLMLLDYLFLQHQGLLKNYDAPDIHTFNTSKVLQTVYDTGGTNSFDLSSQTRGAIVDLRSGHFSSIGESQSGAPKPGGGTAIENVAIAFGTTIHNAKGSQYNDVLIGNIYGNTLDGGDGNDFIYGDGFYASSDVSRWGFSPDHVAAYQATAGQPGYNILKTPPNDSGNDSLLGGKGNDELRGGAGDDYLDGGDDNDTVFGDNGKDILVGGIGDDALDGGIGDDTFIGDAGTDSLTGGTGKDVYQLHLADGADTIIDSDNIGSLTIDGNPIKYAYHEQSDPTNVFKFHQGTITFTFTLNTDLVITRSDSTSDSITIKNFSKANKTLGIELRDNQTQGYNNSFLGDIYYKAVAFFNGYTSGGSMGGGGGFTVPTAIAGSTTIDFMQTHSVNNTAGNDVIYVGGATNIQTLVTTDDGISTGTNSGWAAEGKAGNDILVGSANNDELRGNDGVDQAFGGDGNDILWGDTSTSTLQYRGASRPTIVIHHYGPNAAGNDYTYTDNGTDSYLLYEHDGANDGNDLIDGGDGSDVLEGNGGDDVLFGSYGIDYLSGNSGNDYLSGGEDGDFLYGDYTPTNSAAPMSSKSYDDVIDGGNGNDTLDGGYGADQLFGGSGNDYLQGDSYLTGVAVAQQRQGNDYLDGGDGDDSLLGAGGADTLLGGSGNDKLDGDALNTDSTLMGADYLDGGIGSDTLKGYGGDDSLLGGSETDLLVGDDGNDYLDGGIGDDQLQGDAGSDTFVYRKGDGNDTLFDSAGQNTLLLNGIEHNDIATIQKQGNDTYIVFKDGHFIALKDNAITRTTISISDWQDYDGSGGTDALNVNYVNQEVLGDGGNNNLVAGNVDDYLDGGAGNDVLNAGDGNDTLIGGVGNDTFIAGNGDDYIQINANEGIDTVSVARNATGTDTLNMAFASLSNTSITLANTNDVKLDFGNGNSVVVQNIFASDAKSTQLQFADGTFNNTTLRLSRIQGDDSVNTFIGSSLADIYAAGGGDDTLFGNDGNDILSGEADHDTLNGGNGNDTLTGGAGFDKLIGGAGNDVYVFNRGDGQDVIEGYDLAAGRIDTIQFGPNILPSDITFDRISRGYPWYTTDLILYIKNTSDQITITDYFYSETAGVDGHSIDQIKFANGTIWNATAIAQQMMTGNDASQNLYGTQTGDTINGLGGNDFIWSYSGNDVLNGGLGADYVDGGKGNDTLNGGSQETDTLLGTEGSDTYLYGRGDGADVIQESGLDADTDVLRLGAGILPQHVSLYRAWNDLIVVIDNSATQLTVQKYFEYTSWRIERIEFDNGNGGFWNSSDIAAFVNVGTVNTMTGTSGSDVFVVDHEYDVIVNPGNGYDTVQASRTYGLQVGVEELVLTGVLNIDAYGNSSSGNRLGGNANNNVLDGYGGYDYLYGGMGDDTYVDVDGNRDTIAEYAGEGIDTYINQYGGVLPDNVEIFDSGNSWRGLAIAVFTGNSLDNTLINRGGYASDTTLDGGLGADTLITVDGLSATFIVDNVGDKIIAGAGNGIDFVNSTVTRMLETNVENLTLKGTAAINGTGNTLNNILTGNSAANILDGGTGADSLIGGAGNDTYYIDNIGDVVTENFNEGTDTVNSSVTYTLTSNVESLTLTGTNNLNGTGNGLNNTLIGNSANNRLYGLDGVDILDGGDGADWLYGGALGDTLIGGAGDDRLFIDELDTVLGGAGYDQVFAETMTKGISLNLTTSQVEFASATYFSDFLDARGSVTGVVLDGGEGWDELRGSSYADRLVGGEDADFLYGGKGNDTYAFIGNDNWDFIWDIDSTVGNTDVVSLLQAASNQVWFSRMGNDLLVSVIGTLDNVEISDWYLGSKNHIEQFKTADGKTLLDSNVENLVSAMAAFSPPAAGQTTLPQNYQNSLNSVIAANWQ